jgi:hypothetical protein
MLSMAGCNTYDAWRYRDLTTTAREFLHAGARSDAAKLRRLATDEPVAVISRVDHRLLDAAAKTLHPVGVERLGSPAAIVVEYEFRYNGHAAEIEMFFRRDGGGVWKVQKFLPPGTI